MDVRTGERTDRRTDRQTFTKLITPNLQMGGLINYLPTIKYSARPGNIDCTYTVHVRTPWCFYNDVHGHSL